MITRIATQAASATPMVVAIARPPLAVVPGPCSRSVRCAKQSTSRSCDGHESRGRHDRRVAETGEGPGRARQLGYDVGPVIRIRQRFGCSTPSAFESRERFDMACWREREWVVSGGVCFWVASARAGGGRRLWGRGVLPRRGAWCGYRAWLPVGAPRYLRLCDVDLRPGPRWVAGVAYSRTTFSMRVPRVMPRRSTTRRARARTVSWSTPGWAVTISTTSKLGAWPTAC
jgi:hypothetical protein